MKLKCRVTSLLTILAVSSLLVTLRVFVRLERNLREDSNSYHEVTSERSTDSSRMVTIQTVSDVFVSTGAIEKRNTSISPWDVWLSWVKPTKLYPIDSFHSSKMNSILSALSHYPITKFKLGHRGTQLKTTMYLNGNQRTVFKPKRFSREDIVDGPDNPYAGYDRHNGEIAAFHLDGILGLGLAPPVAGRRINLTKIISLTEHKLMETYVIKNGDICFYGKCYYCKPSDLACSENGLMEGSVTIWLPEVHTLQTWRHPYQRTYVNNRKAKWETDENYCKPLLSENSKYYYLLPDIMDTAVFDYLIGNADRHHFETFSSLGQHGRLLHIDSVLVTQIMMKNQS